MSKRQPRHSPPRWMRVAARLVPVAVREQFLDDVAQEATRLRARAGRAAATRWAVRQFTSPDVVRLQREVRLARTRGGAVGGTSIRARHRGPGSWIRSLDSLGTETRGALRSLARTPGFTTVALLTLAIGIGATSAVFGVVDAVLLRPLPYADPDRLVALVWDRPDGEAPGTPFGHYADMQQRLTTLNRIGFMVRPYLAGEIVLRSDAGSELLEGRWVSAGFFDVLGVSMLRGPGMSADANDTGNAEVVVLSYDAWKNRFGSVADLGTRPLEINGRPHTVVGVLPPGFEGIDGRRAEVWLPQPMSAELAADRESWGLDVIGRIADGSTRARVSEEAETLGLELAAAYPDAWAGVSLNAVPLADRMLGGSRPGLMLLLAGAAAILLVGCANLANLQLARTSERRHELAVRLALGAGVVRVSRPLLLESLLLGIVGGTLGLLAAQAVTGSLLAASPGGMPRSGQPSLDLRLAAFTLVVSIAAGVVFAIAPAMRAARVGYAAIRIGSAATTASDRRFRAIVVAAESAVVLTLIVAAAVSLSGLRTMLAVDPGFATDSRTAMTLTLPPEDYSDASRVQEFLTRVEEDLAAVPGVRAAGAISHLPLDAANWGGALFIEGQPAPEAAAVTLIDWELASPGYFAAAGIPLIEGRAFNGGDIAGAAEVTIVNETLARSAFPQGDALGRKINGSSPNGPWRTIVGIVADVKQQGLADATRPYMYVPATQVMAWPKMQLVVWHDGDGAGLTSSIVDRLRAIEPRVATSDVRAMGDLVIGSVAGPRYRTLLLGVLGGIAVALGAVGIFGVVSYTTAQRRREFGVRLALGAAPAQLVRQATRRGLVPVAWGAAAGALMAWVLARVMAASLYGVSAAEPLTLAASLALLGAVAGLAAWLPARRAATVDPAQSLRP